MRHLIALGLIAAVALVLAPVVEACPASYVKSLGQNTNSHTQHDKAQQVAEKYMENRGLNPETPIGQAVKPYVTGTAVIEDRFRNNFDLDTDSVDDLVDEALGTYAGKTIEQTGIDMYGYGGHGSMPTHLHFHRHFGHGHRDAGSEVGQGGTTKLGG